MPTLFISEFISKQRDANNNLLPIVQMPPHVEMTVAIGASSVQSAAVNVRTGMVRIVSDVICSISVGTNPTATTATMRLAADAPEYFNIPLGQAFKIAVISNT